MLIMAIGAQNALVLRQGLRREHVLPVVLVCALSDAVLLQVGGVIEKGVMEQQTAQPRLRPLQLNGVGLVIAIPRAVAAADQQHLVAVGQQRAGHLPGPNARSVQPVSVLHR